jgi:predicted P-loop ATPase
LKILSIQDGICVNVDEIEGIEKVDDKSCKVYVGTRTYISTYPYETLMSILKNDELVDRNTSKVDKLSQLNDKVGKLLDNSQMWVG